MMVTFAPLLTNSFATSFPIPFDPPVTMTCLPFNEILSFVFFRIDFQIHDKNISIAMKHIAVKNKAPRPVQTD